MAAFVTALICALALLSLAAAHRRPALSGVTLALCTYAALDLLRHVAAAGAHPRLAVALFAAWPGVAAGLLVGSASAAQTAQVGGPTAASRRDRSDGPGDVGGPGKRGEGGWQASQGQRRSTSHRSPPDDPGKLRSAEMWRGASSGAAGEETRQAPALGRVTGASLLALLTFLLPALLLARYGGVLASWYPPAWPWALRVPRFALGALAGFVVASDHRGRLGWSTAGGDAPSSPARTVGLTIAAFQFGGTVTSTWARWEMQQILSCIGWISVGILVGWHGWRRAVVR